MELRYKVRFEAFSDFCRFLNYCQAIPLPVSGFFADSINRSYSDGRPLY
jgi:hypothetical protein